MISITPTISLDDAEVSEQFIRASGTGGQSVKKLVVGQCGIPRWLLADPGR